MRVVWLAGWGHLRNGAVDPSKRSGSDSDAMTEVGEELSRNRPPRGVQGVSNQSPRAR